MDLFDRNYLVDFYREDVRKLESLSAEILTGGFEREPGRRQKQRGYSTTATGRIGEPVPPRIFNGSATKRNSFTPASASDSRFRHSMMWMPRSTRR